MEFIDHMLAWCRGEIFEGNMALIYGVTVLIITFAFRKFGQTPYSRGIIIPLTAVAVLFIATGMYLNVHNHRRIHDYQQFYTENPGQFVKGEKVRTEEFIKWYPVTRYAMAGFIIAGLCGLLVTTSPNWKGVGIGLMLLGFSIIFLDHFSEERALVYHEVIIQNMSHTEPR